MEMEQIHERAHQFDYIREMSCMKKNMCMTFYFFRFTV